MNLQRLTWFFCTMAVLGAIVAIGIAYDLTAKAGDDPNFGNPHVIGMETLEDSWDNDYDPNASLIEFTEVTLPDCTALTFCTDAGEITLYYGDKLDLVGDPNGYTDAAKLFLTHVLRVAALDIIDTDAAIKQWASDGTICEAIGHKWSWGFTESLNLIWQPGYQTEQCMICEKTRSRHLTDWD